MKKLTAREKEQTGLVMESRKMDNRENILTCALELFYQRGYDAVGIQEICQAAGITKVDKCIFCRRCESVCNEVQTVGALGAIRRGFNTTIAPADVYKRQVLILRYVTEREHSYAVRKLRLSTLWKESAVNLP